MILAVEDLSFGYRNGPVVSGASFGVREGEILALLGPNGSGKTTTMKCLNRVLTPWSGRVLVDGVDARNLGRAELARKIAWVPQQGEAPRMKVYDAVLLGRKPHFKWGPGAEDHRKTTDALSMLGLESLSMRWADEISGGELQLAHIARALAQESRIILFDEPTSSLDIANQHSLMGKIRDLIRGSRKAAVLTLHDLNLALRYADSFLLLKDGRVFAAGGREIVDAAAIKAVYGMDARIVGAAGHPLVVPA